MSTLRMRKGSGWRTNAEALKKGSRRRKVSKFVGSTLTDELYRRLAGDDLEDHAEKAILICTVDGNGWPHPAMLSYWEVIAKDRENIRLATYKNSSTTSNMRRTGKLTILIVDERMAYYIKGSAEELAGEMHCSPQNSKLNFRVEQVLADESEEGFEPDAYIAGGITYKRVVPPPGAGEMLRELLA